MGKHDKFDMEDFGFPPKVNVVDLAKQILRMDNDLRRLTGVEQELLELRERYDELQRSSLRHSQKMLWGVFELASQPGVMEAIAKNNVGKGQNEKDSSAV